MSTRVKWMSILVLAAIALATWMFMSLPAELSLAGRSEATSEPFVDTASTRPNTSNDLAGARSVPPVQATAPQVSSAASQPTGGHRANPDVLTEETLVGTKWEREGFGFEFGAAGKLLIGGRERANWHVEGQRVRLYRDAISEEHWLDIVGNKLLWNGQEIGRIQQASDAANEKKLSH